MNSNETTKENFRKLYEKFRISDERERYERAKEMHTTIVQPPSEPPTWNKVLTKSNNPRCRFTMKCFFNELDPTTMEEKRFTYRADKVQEEYGKKAVRFDNPLDALRCKFHAIAQNCTTVIVYDNSFPKPQDELFKMKPGHEIEFDHVNFSTGRPQFKRS